MAKTREKKQRKSPNEIQNHSYLSNVLAFSSNCYQNVDFFTEFLILTFGVLFAYGYEKNQLQDLGSYRGVKNNGKK